MIALKLHQPSYDYETSPQQLTLREYYSEFILPEIAHELKPSSLAEDRTALNQWERYTKNPTISQASPDDLACLRDGLSRNGCSAGTINKYWRELRAMFNWIVEDGHISKAPQISRRSKSKLLKQSPKRQRESLTMEEVTALWRGCSAATYPNNGELPAPMLWRVALVLWWFYGARTMDVIGELTWDNILVSDHLLQFTAQKTGKLQSLPLTPLVVSHLDSIRRKSHKIFSGFSTKGCYLKKQKKWKRGYYATWKQEIQKSAGLSGILIKHFRETMVTRNNGIEAGLGNWMAGHYMPGVSAQNYDLPTMRIRDAVESTPVSACFYEIG